jgi:diguanylate cyclase (GGDEF)-like protein
LRDRPIVFAVSRDEGVIELLETAAKAAGMQILAAENPARAASQAKLAAPDTVVLDDSLDGADWFVIYKRLMEELSFTFIPILVLLDAEGAEAAVSKMKTGLVDVLVKPLKATELKARLKAMLQVKGIHDQMDTERIVLQQKLEEERRLRQQLTSINEELKLLSTTDGLTGIANYRYMRNWLTTEFEIATRYKLPLSAIMVDIDNFKSVNDRFGHPFGDFVLRGVAQIIQERSRRADFAARYGGDEFIVILPNTDGSAGANLAHRIYTAIERHSFEEGANKLEITVSLGISTFPADGVTSAETLVDLADRALYAAKSKGRNRIVTWQELA